MSLGGRLLIIALPFALALVGPSMDRAPLP